MPGDEPAPDLGQQQVVLAWLDCAARDEIGDVGEARVGPAGRAENRGDRRVGLEDRQVESALFPHIRGKVGRDRAAGDHGARAAPGEQGEAARMPLRLAAPESFGRRDRQQVVDEEDRLHIRPRVEPGDVPGRFQGIMRGVQVYGAFRGFGSGVGAQLQPIIAERRRDSARPPARRQIEAAAGLSDRDGPLEGLDQRIRNDRRRVPLTLERGGRVRQKARREQPRAKGAEEQRPGVGAAAFEKMIGQQPVDPVDAVGRGVQDPGREARQVVDDARHAAPGARGPERKAGSSASSSHMTEKAASSPAARASAPTAPVTERAALRTMSAKTPPPEAPLR